MRLVCPNCGAQYEIDHRVIPEAGRDVQCSNCGHGWFQAHPDRDADLADELGELPKVTEPEDLSGAVAPPDAETSNDAQAFDSPDDDRPDEDAPEPEPDTDAPPMHKGLDDGVKDILRQEAEFEMEQRAHEQAQLESQPDLGLEDTDSDEARRRSAQERMARLRDLDEDPDEEEDSGARRDLLPDIEEISSTLDGNDIGQGELLPDVELATARRSGFRRGFGLTLMLLAMLLALYVFAPQLGDLVPALKGPLDAYVALIDKVRVVLDGLMQSATGKMQGAAAG